MTPPQPPFDLDSLPEPAALVDLSGRFLAANAAFCELTGYALPKLLALSERELTPPRWHAVEERILAEQVPARGHSHFYEKEYARADGTPVGVEVRTFLIRDDEGRAAGRWTLVRDIGERLETRRALERYRRSVDLASEAVFWMRMDGGFGYVNEQACRSLGYTREELLGLRLWDIDPRFPPERWSRQWLEMAEAGRRAFETVHRRKDGTIFPVEVVAAHVKFADEEFHTAFVRDISARKEARRLQEQLEAQLAQARKMESIGRLAGGVAHDFNNLLSVILGYAELLEAELPAGSPQLEKVGEIAAAAGRSRDITRQLLAFSRRQVIEPLRLDLNRHIEGAVKTLVRLIGEDIAVRFDPRPGLWPVRFDPAQIDQILINLAVNARDALPRGGTLRIEVENRTLDAAAAARHPDLLPGDHVALQVSDDGLGMAPETLQHIFEPFFTTKGVGQGTGLGLATVYGIVKQNAAAIGVHSEPGVGTRFLILIPRTELPSAEAPPPPRGHGARGTKSILLAEDDPRVCRLVRAVLEKAGYRVLATQGAEEALAVAADGEIPIDLLLTDVVMPGLGGTDLRDRFLVLRPEAGVLFMSGYTSNVIVHQGVLDEDVHFIQKPFTMAQLVAKVRQATGEG